MSLDINFALLLFLGIAIAAVIFLLIKYLSIREQITDQARRMFEQWRKDELALAKRENLEIARREAQVQFEEWKKQYEQRIRQDAIQKSQAVTLGKITEHFIPYLPDFHYNPKDARFIGSPIDFVVFDGLDEGDVRRIIFVEVKTGTSGLSTRERRIRDAIQSGRVEWEETRPALEGSEPSLDLGKDQKEPSED